MNVFENIGETRIPGCFVIQTRTSRDHRGEFVKTFNASAYAEFGLETAFRESFYSISHQNVLRGMHFQSPPHDHAKLVYCPQGTILDAFVDLRRANGHFGEFECVELSGDNGLVLYLPPGVAHGFYVQSTEAITIYSVSSEYNPRSDSGVRWDSCGIPWPVADPIISPRDNSLPALKELESLF